MEERRIREYAVKIIRWQLELQEILMPYLAVAGLTGHGNEFSTAINADRLMPTAREFDQITPRSTTQIQNTKRRLQGNMAQKCIHILTDIVTPGAFTEAVGVTGVMFKRGLYGVSHPVVRRWFGLTVSHHAVHPCMNTSTGWRRPPGRCSSSRRKMPCPVTTSIPCLVAPITSPGTACVAPSVSVTSS